MNLNAPKQIVFIISLVLAVIGLLGVAGVFSIGNISGGWFLVLGYALLAAGNLLKGL